MKVPGNIPVKALNLHGVSGELRAVFLSLLYHLEQIQLLIATAVNFNEITYISQNDQPTPAEGQVMVWKDADAGAGNPKAYIVTTQGGVTYTFQSVEVV